MYRIQQFLNSLDQSELQQLKEKLDEGKLDLGREIKKRMIEYQQKHAKICAGCSSDINPESTNNYSLLLGPDDFKKKASFCGMDCLEYFLSHLKNMRRSSNEQEQIEKKNQ